MEKKVAFYNLGCKVNDFDTESMKACFLKAGYEAVPFDAAADVYVVNTCTVTHLGDRKSRQMLRKARRNNPNAVIVAAGCYAQVAPEEVSKVEEVDLILGTAHRDRVVDEVARFQKDHHRQVYVSDVSEQHIFEDMPIAEHRRHTRAFLKVQDGCNQFCTYCIVPYARGRIRSRRIDSVCEEVRLLVADGFKEFVLSGIHIASYGKDLPEGPDLLALIRAVDAIPGVERIRLGSIEPLLMTEAFVAGLREVQSFCPHFHLSLQSGCNAVLRRMNRHYTAEQYFEIVQRIRRYFSKPAITTDMIVGFPGETDEEFQATKDFMTAVNFYKVHVFKYSRRRGTPAADFDGQVDEATKHRRSQCLIALSREQEQAFLKENAAERMPVLFEQWQGDHCIEGHTPNYIPVRVSADGKKIGQIEELVLQYSKDQSYMVSE